jgi:hypothetical protein
MSQWFAGNGNTYRISVVVRRPERFPATVPTRRSKVAPNTQLLPGNNCRFPWSKKTGELRVNGSGNTGACGTKRPWSPKIYAGSSVCNLRSACPDWTVPPVLRCQPLKRKGLLGIAVQVVQERVNQEYWTVRNRGGELNNDLEDIRPAIPFGDNS